MIYHRIFSSLLIYRSQIWGQNNTSISKMEKLQNKALWIISFKHTRSSINPLHSKYEILKFADNIKLSSFLFAQDSIKSNLPTSLCDSITIQGSYQCTMFGFPDISRHFTLKIMSFADTSLKNYIVFPDKTYKNYFFFPKVCLLPSPFRLFTLHLRTTKDVIYDG